MLAKFQKYCSDKKLFDRTDKILLTVSGGKDSMMMLHLFASSELTFGVAHCNFKLRGDDADFDEIFVRDYCDKNGIEFYSTSFKTEDYALKKGISIQMAARELRYSWFEEVRTNNGFKYIATAHHKNDVAETMLINLTKGTGLAGLHGIRPKNYHIIRPILCFTSRDIDAYTLENNIDFREDLSNNDVKYTRNLIRHDVIPSLEKINPKFIETANMEAEQFYGMEQILDQKIKEEKDKIFVSSNEGVKIEISLLKQLTPIKAYLYYFFRDYDFNMADVNDILRGLEGPSGRTYYSSTHQIVKDRAYLILNKIREITTEKLQILSVDEIPFKVKLLKKPAELEIEKSSDLAYLDFDLLTFPLVLRTWKKGDFFQPLGMKGKKKVSDFLIDKKLSVIEKQHVKVLLSQGEIVWLVDHRINDKFKITDTTKQVLVLKN